MMIHTKRPAHPPTAQIRPTWRVWLKRALIGMGGIFLLLIVAGLSYQAVGIKQGDVMTGP
jgi:hypothetical protein